MAANKKAAGYIAYIFLVMMTVAIATFLILWGKSTTERQTESVVNIASGRLECKDLRIDAVAGPGCSSVLLSNKGMVNIHNARVTFDYSRPVDSGVLSVSGEQVQVDDQGFSIANILPIVQERGNLFGCADKKLVVKCP